MVVLFFIVLFGISAIIVTRLIIGMRKRYHDEEHNWKVEEKEAEREQLQLPQKESLLRYEEEHRKADEEREHVGEESQREIEETGGDGRRSPLERGGRARSLVEHPQREQIEEIKLRFLKPEIICWKEGWGWVVGIEVPEELESPILTQNGQLLEQDSIDELRYRLNHAEGTVKMTWNGGARDTPLAEPERNYLIFKMRKTWQEPGRLVRCSATGYYLVVVPREWKRDEEKSGPAPVVPERVQLDGYKAHFFYQKENRSTVISFIKANGEPIQVETEKYYFRLAGEEIADASAEMGPLFGKYPPSLQMFEGQKWNDIGVIVIGKEGPGRHRWRAQFSPQINIKEQQLPQEVADRGGGWYFVRIYDKENNLLESMDFRFINALKGIEVSQHPLPGPKGHKRGHLCFYHTSDCQIELKEPASDSLSIEPKMGKTNIVIPKDPKWDRTVWELRTADNKASIVTEIGIERVRWSLVEGDSIETLHDTPLRAKRDWFYPTSKKGIRIWFPKPGWIQKILVGFDRAGGKTFPVRVSGQFTTISLSDFCDTKEIDDPKLQAELKFWVISDKIPEDGVAICKISSQCNMPEPPPSNVLPVEEVVKEVGPFRMKSCSTCDHARTQYGSYWCRIYRWPPVVSWIFKKDYSRSVCYNWEGEYEDDDGCINI